MNPYIISPVLPRLLRVFKKEIEKSRRLKKQYRKQIEEYKSGPEEYFVIAAEAYLSEILGIRSFEECKKYINTYHGGMILFLFSWRGSRIKTYHQKRRSDQL